MKAVIVLKDGTVFHGSGFGAHAETIGELIFNTSMTGYQETLTDPSYAGQILLMTYPLIGNYGINKNDFESDRIHARGFAVRELSPDAEHRDSVLSLDEFLKQHNIPGIFGIDTRMLVRHIRDKGVMPAIMATYKDEHTIEPKKLLQNLEFNYSSFDFVSEVSTKKKLLFKPLKTIKPNQKSRRVVLIDYGVKMGIVRQLVARGCEVHVLPCSANADEVKGLEPDGVVLSNGPGDPAILTEAHKTIRDLGGKFSIFGICLGHQLLAHAFGGDTYKLKFGHHGTNHGVIDLVKGKAVITTQNHGFAVGNIPVGFEQTHFNLNDKSNEGMENKNKSIFSVQYHPEACPGPHDSRYLFDKFLEMMG